MKTARIIAILFFLFAVMLPAVAMADVIGKITAFEGNVDILRRGQERAAPVVRLEEPVSEGDILRTKSNGKAEITFIDESIIRLAPGSRLQITEYLMDGGKRKSGVMNLFRGKIRAVVSKSKGFFAAAFGETEKFEVHTPTAVAGVRGTDFFVSYSMGVTGIVVKDGKVDVFNPAIPGQIVRLTAGNGTFVEGDKPPSPPRPASSVEMVLLTKDTGTFGYEAPGGTPPPTGTGRTIETVVIPSSETHPELLKDILAPVVTIAGPPPATNSSTAVFTVTFNEPVTATYTMGSFGATTTNTTSDTFSIASLPEGSWTLTVIATDAAGNTSTTTYPWLTDYTPPASLALTGQPAAITNISTATIRATATDANGVSYRYTLDGATSTGSLTGLSEGSHTIVATATDGAGNTSTTSYSWLTDYTAPVLAFTSSPSAITNANTATFATSSSETVTYSYTLDGTAVGTPSLAGLSEGSHIFIATATDAAGNISTRSYSWLTDYTAAVLAFTSSPAAITKANTAAFATSSSETVTYSYTLDGTAVGTPSLAGLSEGSHIFIATATDAAGNTSSTSYSWLTDYTAPTTSITPQAAPELTGTTAVVNVHFGSNETSAFSYQLDGGTLTSTGSSLSLPGIAEGTHTIDYTATDTAGNTSAPASLSFNLSRYSLNGSARDTSGVISGSVTSGEVAGISNQNWGGWINSLTGTYTSMPSSFTLNAGGTPPLTLSIISDALFITPSNSNNGGYWIDIINGTSDGISALSGTSSLKYLSRDRLGTGTGTMTGSFDGAGKWSATDTGSYTETPLAWSGNIGSAVQQELYNNGDGILGAGDTDLGLLGGIVPSLTNPVDVTYMGQYRTTSAFSPYMWTPVIYSGNASTTFAPSYDNNKFWGYIGGVWKEGAIDGKIYSLYVDQNGNAGILRGSLAGAYYTDISMYSASGLWSPIKIVTGGVLQADLTDLTNSPNNTWNGINSSSGTITGTDSIFVGSIRDGRRDSITNQPWGIWQAKVAGGFSLPITPPFTVTQWSLTTQSFGFSSITPFPIETITGTQTDGTLWTINTGETTGKLLGTTYGYGADIAATTPNTWISVGETIGTFDPVASSWQAVQTGAWLDTNRFLAMTQTTAGQATLTALNIPFAEVGRANLTGTNTEWTINMNNTTFFAYSNGAAPKIWATGDVNGSYNCSACGATPVLTGSGLSANLNMQTWDTTGRKWIATVNGSGIYTGVGTMNNGTAVNFEGAAAGTNTGTGPGTFSGTGAGVVK